MSDSEDEPAPLERSKSHTINSRSPQIVPASIRRVNLRTFEIDAQVSDLEKSHSVECKHSAKEEEYISKAMDFLSGITSEIKHPHLNSNAREIEE